MNQLKKNYLYNICYQLLVLLLPLITVPYVSRVLGIEGVGIYSYTYAIIYYFMLFGLLGINNYGNRLVAKQRDNKEKLSKTFLSIYSLQLVMNFILIIIYLLYVWIFHPNYLIVSYIQIIYLISNAFDINWFFFGLEKFKLTVLRSSLVKLLSLVLILFLVKKESDVYLYTLILSGSTLISQLLLFPFLRKEIKYVKFGWSDIKKHIKPCFILFIPIVAVSLYKVMDKIMIGLMSNVSEVGLYEQAERLVNIPLSIVTALGTVMLPKISNLVSKGKTDIIKKYIEKSINLMMFMSLPLCFGLIIISNDFVPFFLGEAFSKSSVLLCYLATTVVFISFANVIRTQYLLPYEKDKVFITSVIGGAIINLILNSILIPIFQSVGACIGTIASEAFVMLYQAILVRKELPIIKYFKNAIPFLIKTLIMFILVYFFNFIDILPIFRVVIQILVGVVVYGVLNINYILGLLGTKKDNHD